MFRNAKGNGLGCLGKFLVPLLFQDLASIHPTSFSLQSISAEESAIGAEFHVGMNAGVWASWGNAKLYWVITGRAAVGLP